MGVPIDIYAFHRYTDHSTRPSDTQGSQYAGQFRG